MVDLRNCKKGDLLLTTQGSILEYIRPTNETEYLDHIIRYHIQPNGEKYKPGCMGSRTNNGFVFKLNRIPETDHDVIEILKD